jgi:beta-mannanase
MTGGERAAVTDAVGESPGLILWFEDFMAAAPVAGLAAVAAAGAAPVITWEPWRWRDRADSAETLSSITVGDYDEYLRGWALELAAWPSPVYLRFAHEFNGTWYPWTPVGGTPATVYIDAWRHVHRVFGAEGADNVRWIWSPSVALPGTGALANWYPGDEYVDVLGVDGYNWGTSQAWSRWTSVGDLFHATLCELRAVSPDKPILVTEVACAEAGGSKQEWIEQLLEYLDSQRNVIGIIWFDHNKETDWRVASSPGSATAMACALRMRSRRCVADIEGGALT